MGVGGEFDAFVKHPESGMLLLVAVELLLDAVENHTDSRLLPLDGEQAVLQAMLAGEQAVLQAMLAREQEAGEQRRPVAMMAMSSADTVFMGGSYQSVAAPASDSMTEPCRPRSIDMSDSGPDHVVLRPFIRLEHPHEEIRGP